MSSVVEHEQDTRDARQQGVLVRHFTQDEQEKEEEIAGGYQERVEDDGLVSISGVDPKVEATTQPSSDPQMRRRRKNILLRSSSGSNGRIRQASANDAVQVHDTKDTHGETEEQVMFSCNICYELASEPVVTLCGHLYCWPCLYKWLQVQNNYRTCPVCKAGVDRDKVIPVYGRGGNEDPRAKKMETVVPSRPTGQRPQPVDNRFVGGGQAGVFPSIFGFSNSPGFQDQVTPEQQHQAFLSRLLLMLGSFVIMCLLLF